MEKVIIFLTSPGLYISFLIIIIAFIIYQVLRRIIHNIIERNKKDGNHKKRATYVKLLKNIVKYLLVLLSLFAILEVNGVDVSSLLVSLGVVGVVAGLALQDALKDIIQGFNIIADNYFSVGDIVKINSIEGKVIEIGLKTTKLIDFNGNYVVFSNRTIDRAITISDIIYLDILSSNSSTEKLLKKISKLENIKEAKYINNQIKITVVDSRYKDDVKEKALKIIENDAK